MDSQRPLSTDLTDSLRIEILAERTRPGTKLTENAICERYKVSRTPVREALKNLEKEGLVEIVTNRGAFAIGLSGEDIRDLFTLRRHYEVQAVWWAIERRTKEELEAIEESLDFMRFYTARNDVTRMRAINVGFHQRIASAAHNRFLSNSLARIQDYLRYSVRVPPYSETILDLLLKEHMTVFAAFLTNDPEAGKAAMDTHLQNSMKRAKV